MNLFDIIGPVMVGPSSSHTAGAVKIGYVAGFLGMKPDDIRIPESIQIARKMGMEFSFGEAMLAEGHPNSVLLKLTGAGGRKLEVIGESIVGSIINIARTCCRGYQYVGT